MDRAAILGVAVVGVVALSLTAGAVDTGLDTTPDLPGDGNDDAGAPPEEQRSGSGEDGSGQGDDGDSSSQTASESTASDQQDGPALWRVLAGIVVLTAGGVAILYSLTGGEGAEVASDERQEPPNASEGSETVQPSDVPPTNDVYGAWLELQRRSPAPESAAPAEVAARAVESGFDERAVEQLTGEFCAVRYGEAAPTTDRERRARELADRLELGEGGD